MFHEWDSNHQNMGGLWHCVTNIKGFFYNVLPTKHGFQEELSGIMMTWHGTVRVYHGVSMAS